MGADQPERSPGGLPVVGNHGDGHAVTPTDADADQLGQPSPSSAALQTVDLNEPIESLATPATRDLEPGRDRVRAALALGLLGLLTVVIGLGFLLLWHAPEGLTDSDGDLKSRTLFIQALLSPVAGLFGAATGFYFGAGVRQQGFS